MNSNGMAGNHKRKNLCDTLKSQRLIKIFVGNGAEQEGPFFVQEALLCASSTSDYFGKALKHAGSMGGGETGVLQFPDDDKEAFKLFLSWLINRSGRPEPGKSVETQTLLVQAWILADKYMLARFQDVVMFDLLSRLDGYHMDKDVVVAVFHGTSPDSPLRKVAAMEAVNAIYAFEIYSMSILSQLDGATGATISIAEAVKTCKEYMEEEWKRRCKFGEVNFHIKDGSTLWKEYMVSDPKQKPLWE